MREAEDTHREEEEGQMGRRLEEGEGDRWPEEGARGK
jgi:hypothetical protein